MRLLVLSAFLWQVSLSDRRILENFEKKLNQREGQIVGGMVKRYRCIEEYVPIEEAANYGNKLSSGKRRKLHGVKTAKGDPIKPKKSKASAEEVEAMLNVKSEGQRPSVDEEIEKMLHEGDNSILERQELTTASPANPIRAQRRKGEERDRTNLFDHEMSRGGVPISELSRAESGKRLPRPGRQFYVYDFDDDETEYADEEYYEERMPRRGRYGLRRRHYAPMRRNMYYYRQRLPYRGGMRQGPYVPMQPIAQQQSSQQQQQFVEQEQTVQQQPQYAPLPATNPRQNYFQRRPAPVANLQPMAVAQSVQRPLQSLPVAYARQPLSTVAPPVVLEPAERVDPAVSNEMRIHPQRPIKPRLQMKPLPSADASREQQPLPLPELQQQLPLVPSFTRGQLEEATPENCQKIISLSAQFGIKDISSWSRSNCGTLQMFVPGATCQQLWHFIDSCHKRRFL